MSETMTEPPKPITQPAGLPPDMKRRRRTENPLVSGAVGPLVLALLYTVCSLASSAPIRNEDGWPSAFALGGFLGSAFALALGVFALVRARDQRLGRALPLVVLVLGSAIALYWTVVIAISLTL